VRSFQREGGREGGREEGREEGRGSAPSCIVNKPNFFLKITLRSSS
jgi:hypothetical protein